jgi:hypothetical protein
MPDAATIVIVVVLVAIAGSSRCARGCRRSSRHDAASQASNCARDRGTDHASADFGATAARPCQCPVGRRPPRDRAPSALHARAAGAGLWRLAGMGGAQNEQMKHFGDRLTQLTQSNELASGDGEQRLDAVHRNAQKLDECARPSDCRPHRRAPRRVVQAVPSAWSRCTGLGEMQTLAPASAI